MTTPPPADPVAIGKYQILGLAGEGAMGSVYRALDTVLNRTVAIKVMNATIARDTSLRDRFLREAQSAGSLQHPNVVTVFDFGEVNEHLFIAMEFVDGSDLETLMGRPDAMTLQQKLEIIIDVLSGLAYAHQRGIVHRDLKPANIRVTSDARAKLMDFGVAHLASQKMTQTGMMIGTPNYMAPEYISGKPVTTLSDIFSMGAVLYEVLTGRKPFNGETLHALMFSIVQEEPTAPSVLVPGLPMSLNAVVLKAMAKDPAERYATALDMAQALTSVRASLSGAAFNGSEALSTTLAHSIAVRGADAARDAADRSAHRTAAPVLLEPPTDANPARGGSRAVLAGVGGLAVVAVLAAVFMNGRGASSPIDAPVVDAAVVPTTPATPGAVAEVEAPPSAGAERAAASAAAGATAPVATLPRAATAVASGKRDQPAPSASAAVPAVPTASSARGPSPAAEPLPAAAVVPKSAPSPVATAPATPAPAAVTPAPVADARPVAAVLQDLVERYERALSSHDVAAVRQAYAGITRKELDAFEQFFAKASGFTARLTLGAVDVRERQASGPVQVVYEYSLNGDRQKQSFTLRMQFEKDGDSWRIMSVR